MRSASNGLATTLLLLVPLVAVPFAAAIGLPQLSATTAAATEPPDVQPVERAPADESRPPAAEQTVARSQPSADDLFAPLDAAATSPRETAYEEPVSADALARDRRARVRSRLAALAGTDQEQAPAAASAGSHAGADPIVRDDAFADTTAAALVSAGPAPAAAERGARVAPRPFPRHSEPSGNVPAGDGSLPIGGSELTWERAVQRMQELGIEDFALSPGAADQGFHFRCQLSDAGDPGVIHRFEAEAADPLAAVAAAIEQVEGWLEQTASTDSPLEDRLARLVPDLQRSAR